jgi:hypothetical protein
MGNIASLNRDGAGAKTYTYKNGGNQLESVTGVTATNYVYDANGNATTDGRNGIMLDYNWSNTALKNEHSIMNFLLHLRYEQ